MSKTAWTVFLGSLAFTTGIITYVYRDQEEQKARLKAGLVRDEERRQRRRQNIAEHEEQQRLRMQLESLTKEAHVGPPLPESSPPQLGNSQKG